MTIQDLILGQDVVDLDRLAKTYRRYGERFTARILTEGELAWCRKTATETGFLRKVAARIAVKEAVSKALGVGINGLGWRQGVPWKSVEVVSRSQQPPEILLHNEARRVAEKLQVKNWRVSFSHDGDIAMASVVGLI